MITNNTNNVKGKLNIIGRGFIKENSAGGWIISYIPDVPVTAYLDDLLFIATVPNDDQQYAPAYCRLQDKSRMVEGEKKSDDMIKEFTEVRSMGYIRQNRQNRDDAQRGEIIVCAPKTHVLVDLNKTVVIFTVPSEDKSSAPVYFKKKAYNKSKLELQKKVGISENPPSPSEFEFDFSDTNSEDKAVQSITV